MWIGTETGTLQSFNGISWKTFDSGNSMLQQNPITTMVIEKNGNKWIGTLANGLYVYNENGVALPVELINFASSVRERDVTLQWITATEINSSMFYVERKTGASDWGTIAEIKASGNSTVQRAYTYTDKNLNPGIYNYRLKITDFDGSFKYSGIINTQITGAEEYILNQNYPNPFNPSTQISYSLPYESKITLAVYNTLGEMVKQLASGTEAAGFHKVNFNGAALTSGTYIYRLNAVSLDGSKTYTSSGKMLLIK